MSRDNIDWFRRPELILGKMITEYARGDSLARKHYHRAVVLAVDPIGGKLQNQDGRGMFDSVGSDGIVRQLPAIVGPSNPRWSIKARILTDGFDRLLDDAQVRVFWPFLPQDQIGIAIAPGEHVYVVFEGQGMDHGMWMCRVSGHESANIFVGSDSYTNPSAPRSGMDSFESNDPEYDRSDEHAGLAPKSSAMSFFGE